jgi:hypothetical protein
MVVIHPLLAGQTLVEAVAVPMTLEVEMLAVQA